MTSEVECTCPGCVVRLCPRWWARLWYALPFTVWYCERCTRCGCTGSTAWCQRDPYERLARDTARGLLRWWR